MGGLVGRVLLGKWTGVVVKLRAWLGSVVKRM